MPSKAGGLRQIAHAALRFRLAALTACFLFPVLATRAEVVLDGSLGPGGALAGPDYSITADLGRRAGANLFHSFSVLDIGAGESATFSGPADVLRIVSRVTGGAPSSIDGTLRSSIAGADFFLINPAGVMFGPQATVDVGGAFHVATAQQIQFSDGAVFSAVSPDANSLSVAAPEAFGFLGQQGAIRIDGSRLVFAPGRSVGLAAAQIAISGATLSSEGGSLQIVARTSAGEVPIAAVAAELPPAGGSILVADSQLTVDGSASRASGSMRLEAGAITVDNSSLTARHFANGPGGAVALWASDAVTLDRSGISLDNAGGGEGGDLSVMAGGRLLITGAGSGLSTTTLGPGSGGNVTVRAGRVELARNGAILSNTLLTTAAGGGRGGDVLVEADQVQLTDGGRIEVNTEGTGQAGNLSVTAHESLLLSGVGIGGGGLFAQTRGALLEDAQGNRLEAGNAGQLTVSSPDIVVENDAVITASTLGEGDGGRVVIDTGRMVLRNGGSVTARAIGAEGAPSGDGGDVVVTATESIRVAGVGARRRSGIRADTEAAGLGGGIRLVTPRLIVEDRGEIEARTRGSGAGGSITIEAGAVDVKAGGLISVAATAEGAGGNLMVTATDQLTVAGANSRLLATAEGTGAGGTIRLLTPRLTVREQGVVTAETSGAGTGGSISIEAAAVELNSGGVISVATAADGVGGDLAVMATDHLAITGAESSLLATAAGTGSAGNVTVHAGRVELARNGVILSNTLLTTAAGGGRGGDVLVEADQVQLTDGGRIEVNTEGTGQAGNLSVTAHESLLLSGTGDGGGGLFAQTRGALLDDAQGNRLEAGNAGQLTVSSPDIVVENDAVITASTRGEGDGGRVVIDTGRMVLRDGGSVTARAIGAEGAPSGEGGDVVVTATESIRVAGVGAQRRSGIRADTEASGQGGSVRLVTPRLIVEDRGEIVARTRGSGAGGSITIEAGAVDVNARGVISVATTAEGVGGNLMVTATDYLSVAGANSRLLATAEGTGAGGTIRLLTPRLTVGDQGAVTAETSGAGAGGSIGIEAGAVELNSGGVISVATSADGDGGDLAVVADRLHVNGEQTSISATTSGAGDGGNINLRASQLLIENAATVSVETTQVEPGAGVGGDILVQADRLDVSAGGRINADSRGAGAGGGLSLTAGRIELAGAGSSISAGSIGSGVAGQVQIVAQDALIVRDGARIATQTLQSDGGDIDIRVGRLLYLDRGEITTSVAGGAGNGGNIGINARFVVLDSSRIVANAFGGNGGNITINAGNFLRSADSVVDASSRLGISGNVVIDAPNVDIGADLGLLQSDYVDAARLLQPSCGAARGQRVNSFIASGRGGLPESFQGPLYGSLGSMEESAMLAGGLVASAGLLSCSQAFN